MAARARPPAPCRPPVPPPASAAHSSRKSSARMPWCAGQVLAASGGAAGGGGRDGLRGLVACRPASTRVASNDPEISVKSCEYGMGERVCPHWRQSPPQGASRSAHGRPQCYDMQLPSFPLAHASTPRQHLRPLAASACEHPLAGPGRWQSASTRAGGAVCLRLCAATCGPLPMLWLPNTSRARSMLH